MGTDLWQGWALLILLGKADGDLDNHRVFLDNHWTTLDNLENLGFSFVFTGNIGKPEVSYVFDFCKNIGKIRGFLMLLAKAMEHIRLSDVL